MTLLMLYYNKIARFYLLKKVKKLIRKFELTKQ
jgi:hypothetical protein